MKDAFYKITGIVNKCSGIALAIMVITIFMQVVMRYGFGKSLSTSEELTRYIFVWILYLGVNLGIKDNIQIKIDVLDLKLHGKSLRMLKIVQHVLSIIAIVAAMIGSFYLMKTGKMATSPSLHISMWIIYLVFPIGFTLDIIEIGLKIKQLIDNDESEVA